jgi:hypothetical protein
VIHDPGDRGGESWLISCWCKPEIIAQLLREGIPVQVLPDSGD